MLVVEKFGVACSGSGGNNERVCVEGVATSRDRKEEETESEERKKAHLPRRRISRQSPHARINPGTKKSKLEIFLIKERQKEVRKFVLMGSIFSAPGSFHVVVLFFFILDLFKRQISTVSGGA